MCPATSHHCYVPPDLDILQPSIRIGFPLRRSNRPNSRGFHDWSEYNMQNIYSSPFVHPSTLNFGKTDAFVDITGLVSSFPHDLCLRWTFQDPNSGETRVLYGRDTELKWTEVLAGVRSGIVPAQYVSRSDPNGTPCGPMTHKWFLDMVSQFTVSIDGTLLREGLKMCQIWEDFEWMATVMLPKEKEVDFALYTAERLVLDVRNMFNVWHLDSFNRASALIARFNSLSPLPNVCMPILVPPPPYSMHGSYNLDSISSSVSSCPISSFRSSTSSVPLPEDFNMDSEDGI
ncbi:hypothetical protein DFH05DRAFT_1517965 [Lentinula detonsa]|uniref:Uncharacterized protein n=1 Tax=Lentinula detonsa TaxID=2804962 RepID=A0A9W8P9P1_9AGAR|nr:hypothetical protein DFH05DRAFT_1517965 [Lentinula detonsa]